MPVPPLPGKAIKGVYRGYMPIDLPQHRTPNRIKPWWKVIGKPRVTIYPKPDESLYTDKPEYPPLNDASPQGLKAQVRHDWYEKLKKVPSVDGKLYEISKHGAHFVACNTNWLNTYDSLPFVQYLTRTKVVNALPESYSQSASESDTFHQDIMKIVLDQIAIEKYQSKRKRPHFISKPVMRIWPSSNPISSNFVQNIINNVRKNLVFDRNDQLSNYQYDMDPAIRSWWYHSGFEPPNNKVFYRSRKDGEGRINQIIQIEGASALNIRSNSFIEPIVAFGDPLATDVDSIKEFAYPLTSYNFRLKFYNPVTLTGQWFTENDRFDFPHTACLTTDCLGLRNNYRPCKVAKKLDDDEACLNGQAILTAFTWTNSLAAYHGFTPFQEITYPFTCQVLTTDGQNWLFNVFQLNTHTFHRDFGVNNRNNICWSSGLMKLYDRFEDGKFHELNEDVIKYLIRFLSQKSSLEYTKQLDLKPYLGADDRADETIEEERQKLRSSFEQRKNLYLSHNWKVPLWEHIFFKSKTYRNQIKEIKPRYKKPKPKYPKIFE